MLYFNWLILITELHEYILIVKIQTQKWKIKAAFHLLLSA